MRIQTFSILCGTAACDARCPFCVSKMTHEGGISKKPSEINWRNFHCASMFAKSCGVTTVMLTGKGEPTLRKNDIVDFLVEVGQRFPFVELQTNGIGIGDGRVTTKDLQGWYDAGLTTIAVSISHWMDTENKKIYVPHREEYPSLDKTILKIHDIGFSVRLNCILLKGMIDDWAKVSALIRFAQAHNVEQLTLMPVNVPLRVRNSKQQKLIKDTLVLSNDNFHDILANLETEGHLLMELAHGATVYDVGGQNVCLSNCLKNQTIDDKSLMRNLIFFPDGHLRYDWEHKGAILL